jgi:hypothetical protein
MNENVLTKEQRALAGKLLPEIKNFYLAGGTALALQIGHRRSLDFDLASRQPIEPFDLERHLISKGFQIQRTFTATGDEYSALIQETKVTQLEDLLQRTKSIFLGHFNSKLFREQLCYFDDMDYSESIQYLGQAPSDEEVKSFLEEIAVGI